MPYHAHHLPRHLRTESDGNEAFRLIARHVDRRARLIRVHTTLVLPGGRHVELAQPGTPDRLVLLSDGIDVWFEQKTDDGALSAPQREWHNWARETGRHVFVYREPADFVRGVNEARRAEERRG